LGVKHDNFPTKIYPRECFKSSNLVGSVKYSSLKNEDNFKNKKELLVKVAQLIAEKRSKSVKPDQSDQKSETKKVSSSVNNSNKNTKETKNKRRRRK